MNEIIKINNYNTTFVLGYWYIKENIKKNLDHYKKFIPETFNILKDQNIIFFYNENFVLEMVKECLQSNKFTPINLSIEELPTYGISEDYLQSCINQDNEHLLTIDQGNEKGIIHYIRDCKRAGSICYKKLFTVWSSKILLVEKIINKNQFDTKFFSWADASISILKQKVINWNFIDYDYSEKYIYHYDGAMKYYGNKINLRAGFIFGYEKKWLDLIKLYKKQLYKLKDSNYAHDEETILNTIYKQTDIFKKIL